MKRHIWLTYLIGCVAALLAGCGSNMRYQAKCWPDRPTEAFDDGTCTRNTPPNTVARAYRRDFFIQQAGGQPNSQPRTLSTGAGTPPADVPFPVTRATLQVGQNSYNTYCAPCHGIAGYGDGMVVQRGFPAPPSFHSERLRDVPPGYVYTVITNGYGIMYSYAARVPPEERWAVAAYVKALQLSQHASPADAAAAQGASQP